MEETWGSLFSAMEMFEKDQAIQKRQGSNDFNLLSSVLSVHDEVRLHTRFIYTLLNPEGKHYQGACFLKLFLKVLGRQDWIDPMSSVVRKEYCPDGKGEQIDLLISDGKRHILIENKLNAQDQKRQVERYLQAIGATEKAEAKNTLFVYLTKNRESPSSFGLGELKVCHQTSRLLNVNGQPVAHYQNLSYRRNTNKNSIHAWLNACINAVEEKSNIAWAIRDYQAVVERATREYVSRVKTLKEMLDDGIAEGKRYHQQAIQLTVELPGVQDSWLEDAMTVQLEGLFEPAISTGAVIKIGPENAELLSPFLAAGLQGQAANFLYEPGLNFFRPTKRTRSRGTFYLVDTGPLAKQMALMLYYGTELLHVGYLLTDHAENLIPEMLSALKLTKPPVLSSKVFPGAMTYAETLRYQGIIHLADFVNSRQRDILHRLVINLGLRNDNCFTGEL